MVRPLRSVVPCARFRQGQDGRAASAARLALREEPPALRLRLSHRLTLRIGQRQRSSSSDLRSPHTINPSNPSLAQRSAPCLVAPLAYSLPRSRMRRGLPDFGVVSRRQERQDRQAVGRALRRTGSLQDREPRALSNNRMPATDYHPRTATRLMTRCHPSTLHHSGTRQLLHAPGSLVGAKQGQAQAETVRLVADDKRSSPISARFCLTLALFINLHAVGT